MQDPVVEYLERESPQHYQREITRLCIECALLLLRMVQKVFWWNIASAAGIALGMIGWKARSPLTPWLSTLWGGYCLTSTRKNVDRGINMQVGLKCSIR